MMRYEIMPFEKRQIKDISTVLLNELLLHNVYEQKS